MCVVDVTTMSAADLQKAHEAWAAHRNEHFHQDGRMRASGRRGDSGGVDKAFNARLRAAKAKGKDAYIVLS